MRNEASNKLLKAQDKVTQLELISDKLRVMSNDVSEYLLETPKEFLMFYQGTNGVKMEIIVDCVSDLIEEISKIKKYLNDVRSLEKENELCA